MSLNHRREDLSVVSHAGYDMRGGFSRAGFMRGANAVASNPFAQEMVYSLLNPLVQNAGQRLGNLVQGGQGVYLAGQKKGMGTHLAGSGRRRVHKKKY